MRRFLHRHAALRIHAGEQALSGLAADLRRAGLQRPVVLTGPSLAASPLAAQLVEAIGAVAIGSQVRRHSPHDFVSDAARLLREQEADAIVVLGGGSAAITARGAVIFHSEGEDLERISTRRLADGSMESPRLLRPKLPIFGVPTTPNTAHVKAGAGIFDTVSGERRALFDPKTRFRSLALHPDFLMSAPQSLVVSASLDGLVLAIEGLMGQAGDDISDALLLHSLRQFTRSLTALPHRDDADLRLDLAMAGVLAGRGTDHAPAGVTTALGHATGANFGIDNGHAKAVLLPHALRFNAAHASKGQLAMCEALNLPLGPAAADRLAALFSGLFDGLGLPASLSDLGLSADDLGGIARRAMKDWFILGNPRRVQNVEELEALLHAALSPH